MTDDTHDPATDPQGSPAEAAPAAEAAADEDTAGSPGWTAQRSTFAMKPFRVRYHGYSGDLSGDAVDRLKSLAIDGTKPDLVMIPTDGLGRGLPDEVPVLWDRAAQEPIPLFDIIAQSRPPLERTGIAQATTLESFIALVKRHQDQDSALFAKADWPNPALTAVIDYHAADGTARFCEHRIRYEFPVTKELAAWIEANEQPFKQAEFALFLEEHVADLSIPFDAERGHYERLFRDRFALPNELIDFARALEIRVGARVKNASRLKSGERVAVFETEHTGANGEAVDVPGLFHISVNPFERGDGEPKREGIVARLRYRVVGGEILWSYSLYQWEDVLRGRIRHDLARAARETGLPSYDGAPEIAD